MKPLGFHVLDGLEDTLTSTALSESADSFGDSVSTWILCTLDSENRCRKDTEELSFKLGRKGGVMPQQRMGKANEKRTEHWTEGPGWKSHTLELGSGAGWLWPRTWWVERAGNAVGERASQLEWLHFPLYGFHCLLEFRVVG